MNKHKQTKIILRLVGFILLTAGLTLSIIGFLNFGNFDSNLFMLTLIGLPCLGFGFALVTASFRQNIARYIKNEHAPIINEFSEDISPAVRNYASAVKEGMTNANAITCACGANNEPDAKFCKACGKALRRTCQNCGKEIASESNFCSECGQPLN